MKKTRIYILLAALVFSGAGCTKTFLDVNTNPNDLPSATPSYVITNAMNVTASNQTLYDELGYYWAGQWTQSGGYILSTQQFAYQYTDGDFNYWDGIYDNLEDYQYVIDNADKNDQAYFKGPAMIMQAMLFQQLVDMYGSIPYSQALKATGNLAPAVDDQKAVYEALIGKLDSAIAFVKSTPFASAFTGSDIVFRGSTAKWAQFANSLKMRILMRQSRVSGRDSYITAAINKIVADGSGFITGSEVGVGGSFFWLQTAGKLNPQYDRWGYDANNAKRALNNFPRLTEFLVNSLVATNDTFRLKRIGYAKGGESGSNPGVSASPEITANYAGNPFGKPGVLPSSTSSLGPSVLTKGVYNKPFVLMTAAEVQFLLAEAKQRYGAGVNLPNSAQTYYEEGIRQSYRALGASTAGLTAFLASGVNNVDFTASTDKLAAIYYQKWVAEANFNGLEAWSDYRKTGVPNTPQATTVTTSDRPLRLYYPNTEKGANTNVSSAASGIDALKTRLFWDVD
jgi:Starch-binding associating with outer membrane